MGLQPPVGLTPPGKLQPPPGIRLPGIVCAKPQLSGAGTLGMPSPQKPARRPALPFIPEDRPPSPSGLKAPADVSELLTRIVGELQGLAQRVDRLEEEVLDAACKAAQFQGHLQEQLVDASRREHEQRMSLAKALVDMLDTEREARMREAFDLQMATRVEISALASGAGRQSGGEEGKQPDGGAPAGSDVVAQVAAAAAAEVRRASASAKKEWEVLSGEMRELCGRLAEDLAAQRAEAARFGALQDQPPQDNCGLSPAARLRCTVAGMQARLQQHQAECEGSRPEPSAREPQACSGSAVLAPAAPVPAGWTAPRPGGPGPGALEAGAWSDGGGYM